MKLLLLVLCALVLAPAAAPNAAKARVWLADTQPVVVRGASFRATERVRITVVSGKQILRKSVLASARGVLVARFEGSLKLGCNSGTVTAVGARGSRAVVKIPGIECPPGPADPNG